MLIIIAHIVANGMRNEACFLTLHFCCAGGEGGGEKNSVGTIRLSLKLPKMCLLVGISSETPKPQKFFVLGACSKRPA